MTFNALSLAGPDPNPMTRKEVLYLKELASTRLPVHPMIVQVGAERGCSTVALLEAAPTAVIFSIDIGERPEESANVHKAGHDPRRVIRLLGRSQDIGFYWGEWKADLVYIDGDHRFPGVREDIAQYSQIVRLGGLLLLHDYIDPDHRAPHIVGRVWEAVHDALESDLQGFVHLGVKDRLLAFQYLGVKPND